MTEYIFLTTNELIHPWQTFYNYNSEEVYFFSLSTVEVPCLSVILDWQRGTASTFKVTDSRKYVIISHLLSCRPVMQLNLLPRQAVKAI